MEFYSDSKPNLIGPKIKMQLHNILKTPACAPDESYFVKFMKYIYNGYIKDNLVIISIVVIIIVSLCVRYFSYKRKKRSNGNKKITENYEGLLNEISVEQIKHIVYSDQPTVDPTKSVVKQDKEYTNYPPADLSINLNSKDVEFKQKISPDPPEFENLNTPNYNYEAVHYNPRTYYNGTYNTYENSMDTNIPNPIGLPVNFNTSTEKFVKFATDANNDNVNFYQSILDNKDYNMTNNFYTTGNRAIDPPFMI